MADQMGASDWSGLRRGLCRRTVAGGLADESDREAFCRGPRQSLGPSLVADRSTGSRWQRQSKQGCVK